MQRYEKMNYFIDEQLHKKFFIETFILTYKTTNFVTHFSAIKMNSITLSELTDRVQETIRNNFDTPQWIRAEISELRENQNGHCYLEFIEKDEHSDNLLAKTKAIVWSSTYRMLKPYFESSTGETLRAGLKVLVAITVEFSGVYGFSLNVRDIDPTFTIGELAARRLKIIRQLEADGIADMNKQLILSARTQRLAIISSPTAAGYDDFMNQLHNDSNHFAFYTRLFPSVMQGEQAEASIIASLDKIYAHFELFDAVVIIRGGGATTDLACFDSYELALNCAQFPLPMISGIGHQRDVTILDMVAHTSLKTPTAVAEFLIQQLTTAENELLETFLEIANVVRYRINSEKQTLSNIQWKIKQSLQSRITIKLIALEKQKNRLRSTVRSLISNEKNKLSLIARTVETRSPAYLLKYGYSITTLNGKRINSITEIKNGDTIRTYLHNGNFESNVKK